jgi:hypothetical protein
MVGKIYIKCAGGYHPDMGKSAIDPELAKREAREKARAARQQAGRAKGERGGENDRGQAGGHRASRPRGH